MPVGTCAIFAPDTLHALASALIVELPALDATELRAALERAAARLAQASEPDWESIIDARLELLGSADEAAARAAILRSLSDDFEHELDDAERAFAARVHAFAEAPETIDLDPLLRLARATDRWSDLPLDAMFTLARIGDDDERPAWFAGIGAAWERRGESYRAADCHEWVLALVPGDQHAHDALERFYRAKAEWSSLVELLRRRAPRIDARRRAVLFRDLGAIYDRELGDTSAALDAYRMADQLEPGHAGALDALARLYGQIDAHDDAMAALERLIRVIDQPAPRARALHRAAEIAWRALDDGDTAQDLLSRARKDDPDFAAAIDALVALRRDRGELAGALELLLEAAERPALAADRARLLGDAAEVSTQLGEPARAAELFRVVHAADPCDRRAAAALAELYWEARDFDALLPILIELCGATHDPRLLLRHLLRLGEAATARGLADVARDAFARAVTIDPSDPSPRRALADLWFERGAWSEARALYAELLDEGEDALSSPACVELHHRVARSSFELRDPDLARRHASIALALDPAHRPTLLLRLELDAGDAAALVATHLALAAGAPADEKATRYATVGDLYARLGDHDCAREMYREALAYRPGDHVLLTKSLDLVAGSGDWTYSLDLVHRLIDTEQDPAVRARYHHLAGMILRDELGRRDDAAAALGRAIESDPQLYAAADELEALLEAARDPAPLIFFYYRRLEQLRHEPCRAGELLRLWDRLGERCLAAGRRDDAWCAFEVALTFAPDDAARRHRLADLYAMAGVDHLDDAIAQHHEILAGSKRRTASYEALALLYARTGRRAQADACTQALAVIGVHAVADARPISRPLTARPAVPLDRDGWLALSGEQVDPRLSALFALVAPAVAAARARLRPPPRRPAGTTLADDDRPIARAVRRAIGVLDLPRPLVVIDRDQAAACRVTLRRAEGALAPALVLGQAALDTAADERALAFTVARRLADLHPERFARLLCPRADELAQIIELSLVLGAGGDSDAARSRAAHWLAASLHPVALDQVVGLGKRLRAAAVDPGQAALDWLEATDRVADRLGLVVSGDLPSCVRALELEPATRVDRQDRVLELVWSSVTEEMFAVRARVEGWPTAVHPNGATRRAIDAT